MPTEANGVIGVSSVGPSKRKAYYSDYGVEQTDVSAPGRRLARHRDGTGEPEQPGTLVLSGGGALRGVHADSGPVPDRHDDRRAAARLAGDPLAGEPACYRRFQGTSMASPHAVGVAALIVAEYGKRDSARVG